MISKFKKHRRTFRPPFNAENLFLLGTARMMFWRRSLRQKIVKHKIGLRSRRAQHVVALAREKSIPLDEVGFETRFHCRDGVFSDPHPTFSGIADEVGGRDKEKHVQLDNVGFETTFHCRDGVFSDPHPIFVGITGDVGGGAEEMDVVGGVSTPRCSKSIEEPKDKEKSFPLDNVEFETGLHRQDEAEVHGTSEEMDVVGGVSKTKHISTTHCSISSVGTRLDSPASYTSTGASLGATSQNRTDVIAVPAEVHGTSLEMDVVGGVSKMKHISTHCSISSAGTRVDSPASYRSTGASVGATSQNRTTGIAAEVHGTFEEMDVVGGISKTKHLSTTHCSIPSVGTSVDSPTSYKSTGGIVGATSQNRTSGIAAEIHGTFEEMDVAEGVSKMKHISTTRCSIPSMGTRVDSPASYKSTGGIVGATSQNPSDGIAAEVHATSEEMDVAGGVSETKHISTTHCSNPSVGTRVDSPASYKSTGGIVGATSQNPTDGIAAEVHGTTEEMDVAGGVSEAKHISTTHCSIPSGGTREDSPASNRSTESSSGTYVRNSEAWALSEMENELEMWREAQVHEKKTLSERQQKIIASDVVIWEMRDELSCLQERVFEQKKLGVRLKKIIDEQKEEHERMYQERVVLIDELHFKQKLIDVFCEYPKKHQR